MSTEDIFQKGDRIKIKSVRGLKKGFGLSVGSEGVVIDPQFDAFNNGGFLLDGVTPLNDVIVKLDNNNYQTIIPKKNITRV